jgi:hypothetical protein
MIVCEFGSDLDLLDRATHYRASQKDGQGPISKIIRREQCSLCHRTILISTDTGVNATFATRHWACIKNLADERE